MENINMGNLPLGMDLRVNLERLKLYNKKKKSGCIAFFLALIGFHYLYLGKWGWQIVFWATGGFFLLWWFIDLFRVSGMVEDYNRDVKLDVLLRAGY